MKHAQLLLDILATFRKWRDAQLAYNQALETGDDEAIAAAKKALDDADREYSPYKEPEQ